MSFEAVLGSKEFEFVVSEVTLTVVARRSTSGGHGVSVLESVTGIAVVGRTHFRAKTVSLALLMSSTSLLSGSKNFFKSKGFKLPVLESIITGKFFNILFRIMQHREIFILNFNTQLAIIHVFHFINCFPFLIPNELTKYQAT
jgi:hypothetical protein